MHSFLSLHRATTGVTTPPPPTHPPQIVFLSCRWTYFLYPGFCYTLEQDANVGQQRKSPTTPTPPPPLLLIQCSRRHHSQWAVFYLYPSKLLSTLCWLLLLLVFLLQITSCSACYAQLFATFGPATTSLWQLCYPLIFFLFLLLPVHRSTTTPEYRKMLAMIMAMMMMMMMIRGGNRVFCLLFVHVNCFYAPRHHPTLCPDLVKSLHIAAFGRRSSALQSFEHNPLPCPNHDSNGKCAT